MQAEETAQTDVDEKLKEIEGFVTSACEKAGEELILGVATVKPKLHVNVHKP